MTDLELLIQTADCLIYRLDQAAENERKFGSDICLELERMSWEILRTRDNLQIIADVTL